MIRKPLILTAQVIVLAILGCSSLPFLAPPTETPTPTATATATPSPTITPTSTATFTPTPVPLVTIEELSSGELLYRNHNLGIELTFPENWIVLDLVEDKIGGPIDEARDNNPDMDEAIERVTAQMGAQSAQLVAFPITVGGNETSLSSFFAMIAQENDSSLPDSMEEVLDFFGGFLVQLLNGLEIKEKSVLTAHSGQEIGKILFEWDFSAVFESDAFEELFDFPGASEEGIDLLGGFNLLLQYNVVELDENLLLFISTSPSFSPDQFDIIDDVIKTIEITEASIQSR